MDGSGVDGSGVDGSMNGAWRLGFEGKWKERGAGEAENTCIVYN